MRKDKIFWWLFLGLFTAIFLPTTVQQGMFFDGITYSTVSNNLANGIGSFLEPHYTKTAGAKFHEHPPLVFFMQSLFFRIFGDGFLTEKMYSLFITILTLTGIVKCWNLFNLENKDDKYSWLPVLLFLTVPLVSWSYKNNILENTMGVFTIFSVYFILKSLRNKKTLYLMFSALLVIMAFLSKGFTGLFPLAVPIIYGFTHKKIRIGITYNVYLLLLTFGIFGMIVWMFPALKTNLMLYIDTQLLPSLNNERNVTTTNRFWILYKLVLELAVPILILIFSLYKLRLKKYADFKKQKSIILTFMLIGLSASIPIVVSMKQRAFYLIPSMPFFVLAISFVVRPYVQLMVNKMSIKTGFWLQRLSYFIVGAVVVLSGFLFGNFSRDENKIKDINKISEVLPEGAIIRAPMALRTDYSSVAYLGRLGYLSLDNVCDCEYYLSKKGFNDETLNLDNYQSVELGLVEFDLWRKEQ